MYTEEARQALTTERQKVLAERDAYREFEQRIVDIAPVQPTVSTSGGTMQLLEASDREIGTAKLRKAYESTVMSVDHYEEDYSEEFLEHLEAELGVEYAEMLRSDVEFTPPLKQGILTSAANARQSRTSFAAVLAEEEELLDKGERLLVNVRPLPAIPGDMSFERLLALHDQLGEDEERIETLLTERQEHLHQSWAGLSRSNRIDPKSLNHYLYNSLPTTYPVLSSLTQLLTDIRDTRKTTARHIAGYYG